MAKVLVSLDDSLLKRIDRAVERRGLTRSAYFARLATRDLDAELGPGARPEVRAALERLDQLFAGTGSEDSTAIIRAMRDAR